MTDFEALRILLADHMRQVSRRIKHDVWDSELEEEIVKSTIIFIRRMSKKMKRLPEYTISFDVKGNSVFADLERIE
jgi:hypothetical protein